MSQQLGATDVSLTLLIQGPKLPVHQPVTRWRGGRGRGLGAVEADLGVVGAVGEGTSVDVESGYRRTSKDSKLGVCRAFPRSLEPGELMASLAEPRRPGRGAEVTTVKVIGPWGQEHPNANVEFTLLLCPLADQLPAGLPVCILTSSLGLAGIAEALDPSRS